MRWRWLFAILLGVGCEDVKLHPAHCTQPCYTGPKASANVGECRYGIPICDEQGLLLSCDYEIVPTAEACNGLDEDCNGRIDDNMPLIVCGSDVGLCYTGYERCVHGELTCHGSLGPTFEDCDGLDNDCDGKIDESDDLPVEFCYTGEPPSSAAHPPCHPGARICADGVWACANDHTPVAEICGNNIDDDCNGLKDDAPPGRMVVPWDIVLIVDRSCSMDDEIDLVRATVGAYLDTITTTPDYHFWLIDLPAQGDLANRAGPNEICHPMFTLPLSECPRDLLRSAISTLAANHGGIEASYDATYDVAAGSWIAWTPGSKRAIVFFGDENGYSNAGRNITEASAATAVRTSSVAFYGFVAYPEDYDAIGYVTTNYGELLGLFELTFALVCE